MQKFIVRIDSTLPVTSAELVTSLHEVLGLVPEDDAIAVIEIPQPPFPSGMDKNLPWIMEADK